MKVKLLIPLFALLFPLFIFSQELPMQNGSWTECNFLFTDSGGSNANYNSNENLTLTLCPQSDGDYVYIEFFEFSTQLNSDVLSVYDGDSINSPLIGEFSGNNIPQLIQADNATGCLTLNFVSDASVTSDGWSAEVICVSPFVINQPSDYAVCDETGSGIGLFDFTSKDAEILGNLDPSNYVVSYYESQFDADAQTNPLVSPYANVTNPQTIFVNVFELSTGNIEQTAFTIFVNPTPILNILDIYEICDGSSIIVDSGLTEPNNQYAWYYNGFIISDEVGPALLVSQAGVYSFQVFTFEGCTSFTDFEVIISSFDGIASPATLEVCDDNDDGFASFDLLNSVNDILGGNNGSNILVSFHETQADADNAINALDPIYTNTLAFTQTLYARVFSGGGDCFDTTTLELIVNIDCVSATSVEVIVCGDDPNIPIDYDLTSQESNMVNGQNPSDFTFEYYLSQTDAEAQNNPIANPEVYVVSGNGSTVHVRIEDNQSGESTIVQIFVNFSLGPQIVFNDFYAICSGQEIVLTPLVSSSNGVDNFTYLWSTGDTDPEIVVFEPGVYSVTITDNFTDCSSFAEVLVDQGNLPITSQPQNIVNCGGANSFDLTSVYPELLNNEDPTNFNISFHLSSNDAFNLTNSISTPEVYTSTSNNQTIYVVVQNISDPCVSIESFQIITENCPIEVDCGADPVNNTYCYELNDATQYTYTSTDGSPLQVLFNAGQVEVDWDELYILDSDGTTNLNPEATTYGNDGDLTGLSFISTGDTITIYVDSDNVFACADQNYIPIDYDVSCVDPNALPNCTSILITPENGSTSVNENIDLSWTASSGVTNGYKLSLGVTSGGTEVLDQVDVGDVLTYDVGTLDYEVTYYVTIVAYNDNGDAEGCTEQSFTTRANPNQIVECDGGALNTTYCYGNNDNSEFSFESSDGLPLTLIFNSGGTEVNFDEITIVDSDGSIMNPNEPYGNAGNFSGLTYTSSGSSIAVLFDSDGSVSCQSGSGCCTEEFNFDVFCASTVGFIQVNAFVDTNTNTIFDTNELNFSNGYFTYEMNNDGNINTVNSSTGNFQIISANSTDTYDITFNLYEESAGCYDVTIPMFNGISVATGDTVTVDFPVIEEQSCEDLAVYLINYWTPPRPGFTHENHMILENLGFTTISSGTVEFVTDPQLIFNGVTSVNPNYTITNTGTGFTVDFVNLQPGDFEDIEISLTCPATVELDEIVTNSATYITDSNDLVASNNYSTLSELVVGSWDPNDKMEAHGPRILYDNFVVSDEYLYYTVRFQNLGTFAATFVRIEDQLNNQLDETTFQMLRSSHDYVVTRTENNLEWYFDNINLPAEQDDAEGSQGFVYFRIKPKPGYAIGDIIPNTAAIYFDFNAPVITNRFDSEFVEESLSVLDVDFISFDMYPNPAKDKITIEMSASNFGIADINIYDLQGKLILEETISEANSVDIDISDLQSGMYFVKLNTNKKTLVKKLIIE